MKIKGIEFSEETIVKALERAGISLEEPKPYQFQAGDVVEYGVGSRRIICLTSKGNLEAFGLNGYTKCASGGQKCFENAGYRKIGVLSDYIK